jgi:hypothetical protein
MAAGIIQGIDKGAVGFVQELGQTWHQFPEYEHIDGQVNFDKAREVLGYEVVKVPLKLNAPGLAYDNVETEMRALVRTDKNIPVYVGCVTEKFEVVQNSFFIDELENNLFANNPQLAIESVGTLWSGRIAFMNILLSKFHVKKDQGETVTRLMYYNAFGGKAIAACAHDTRIVCNNTLNIAEAQGAANKTLYRFTHTQGVTKRVNDYLADLNELQAIAQSRKDSYDYLADKNMTTSDVEKFIGNILPMSGDPKLAQFQTTKIARREKILDIFENAADLQGAIRHTRYAMMNAVTNFNQYLSYASKEKIDPAANWWNVATGGTKHQLNQKTFDILMTPEIPDVTGTVPTAELIEAAVMN